MMKRTINIMMKMMINIMFGWFLLTWCDGVGCGVGQEVRVWEEVEEETTAHANDEKDD